MKMSNLMGMMSPLMTMIENMLPKEEAKNSGADFATNLIDAFFPDSDEPTMGRLKTIVIDIAVVAINRDPDAFERKLYELQDQLNGYLKYKGG